MGSRLYHHVQVPQKCISVRLTADLFRASTFYLHIISIEGEDEPYMRCIVDLTLVCMLGCWVVINIKIHPLSQSQIYLPVIK